MQETIAQYGLLLSFIPVFLSENITIGTFAALAANRAPASSGCRRPSSLTSPSGKMSTASPRLSKISACLSAERSGEFRFTGNACSHRARGPMSHWRKISSFAMVQKRRGSASATVGGSQSLKWLGAITTPPVTGTFRRHSKRMPPNRTNLTRNATTPNLRINQKGIPASPNQTTIDYATVVHRRDYRISILS